MNFREVPLGVRVRRLVGEKLPKGATVTLTCTRGACRRQSVKVGANGRVSFNRLKGARLRNGTQLLLRATLPGAVGSGTRYTIRYRGRRDIGPKRTFCLRPGTLREGSCSTRR